MGFGMSQGWKNLAVFVIFYGGLFLFLESMLKSHNAELRTILEGSNYCTYDTILHCRPGMYYFSGPNEPGLIELHDEFLTGAALWWIPSSSCRGNRFVIAKLPEHGYPSSFCKLVGYPSIYDPRDVEPE